MYGEVAYHKEKYEQIFGTITDIVAARKR